MLLSKETLRFGVGFWGGTRLIILMQGCSRGYQSRNNYKTSDENPNNMYNGAGHVPLIKCLFLKEIFVENKFNNHKK